MEVAKLAGEGCRDREERGFRIPPAELARGWGLELSRNAPRQRCFDIRVRGLSEYAGVYRRKDSCPDCPLESGNCSVATTAGRFAQFHRAGREDCADQF